MAIYHNNASHMIRMIKEATKNRSHCFDKLYKEKKV